MQQGVPMQQMPVQQVYVPKPPKPKKEGPGVFKKAWTAFIGLIVKPMETVKSFPEGKNFGAAMLIIGFQALFSALFAVFATIKTALPFTGGWFGISWGKVALSSLVNFLLTGIFSIGLAALLAVVLMLAGKIIGSQISFTKGVVIASIKSLVSIPFILVSYLFIFIVPTWAAFFFYGAAFVAAFYVYEALVALGGSRVKTFYISLAVSVVMLIAFLILVLLVGPVFFPENYLDSIRGLMNNLSFETFLQRMM